MIARKRWHVKKFIILVSFERCCKSLKSRHFRRAWLEELDQFVHGHFDVAQDGAQQAGA
jgi:hypothetical protein